jgi:cyanophycinase-like exopeptidase
MAAPLCLAGSGEFLPGMAIIDRRLLRHARKAAPVVAVVLTAPAPDRDARFEQQGDLGLAHFRSLGAQPWLAELRHVKSAQESDICSRLESSDLIYFAGGDAGHLVSVLRGSRAWSAVLETHRAGALVAACSSAAMAMGAQAFDWQAAINGSVHWVPALGLLPRVAVIPEFDRLEAHHPDAVEALSVRPPAGTVLLGIDQETAALRLGETWEVAGRGRVTLFAPRGRQAIPAGQTLDLPDG